MKDGDPIVEIFTDGACSGNPGPGGWGVVLRYGKHEREIYGSEPSTTNNRMELTAAIRGLEALTRPSVVRVSSDSRYVVDGATNSLRIWRSNGWMTQSRRAVKNVDLWERLDELIAEHTVEWVWVRGHSGHPENERADRLAVRGAEEAVDMTPTVSGSEVPYHPNDLLSVRDDTPGFAVGSVGGGLPATNNPQQQSAGLPDDDHCRHELPPGQCDYCRMLPSGVLPRGFRTRGGRAYHNDARCTWLLEGQRQSARQGKNTHDVVAVAWHAVDPGELQPCEWCCTPQWIARHRR